MLPAAPHSSACLVHLSDGTVREKNGVPDSCGLLAEAAIRGIFAAAAMCTDATASLEHVVLTTASAAGHTAAMHSEVGSKCPTHCQVYKPKQAASRKYTRYVTHVY